MYNVLIAIACGGTVHAETVTSLIGALQTLGDKGVRTAVSIQIGGYKPHNCNKLVAEAQANNMSHIMFIDADMIFPSSGIMRLIDNDKDIVGANYKQRGNPQVGDPGISVVKIADEKGNFIPGEIPSQLFRCAGLGLGFTLVKMHVFDKLEKPYFRDAEDAKGEHRTEDIVFCLKAAEADCEIWCNPSIAMGHIGSYTY